MMLEADADLAEVLKRSLEDKSLLRFALRPDVLPRCTCPVGAASALQPFLSGWGRGRIKCLDVLFFHTQTGGGNMYSTHVGIGWVNNGIFATRSAVPQHCAGGGEYIHLISGGGLRDGGGFCGISHRAADERGGGYGIYDFHFYKRWQF